MVFDGQTDVASGVTIWDEEASRDCIGYEQVQNGHRHDIISLTKDITDDEDGNSNLFRAPSTTTSVVGEKRVLCGNPSTQVCYQWIPINGVREGSSHNWRVGEQRDYVRNVIATYTGNGPEIPLYKDGDCNAYGPYYCPEAEGAVVQLAGNDDDMCVYSTLTDPIDIIDTTTVIVQGVTYDKVVTEVYSGDTVRVRGHIWARNPKPVKYWYVAQIANDPAAPILVDKLTPRIIVDSFVGVMATEEWSFTAPEVTKDTLVRIFLKIRKADGTLGSIRTKIIVHPYEKDELTN